MSLFAHLPLISILQIRPLLGEWDLEEQTRVQHLFLRLLSRWTHSPCLSFIYNDFVNSVTERSPLSPHAAIQSVTQPNPIKWLLMNFKQVLSPSSPCAMLRSPLPAPSMRGLTLSPLFLFTLFLCLFDMLNLLLSHTLYGTFCPFQSLCSFLVLALTLCLLLFSLWIYLSIEENMKQFVGVLFSVDYLCLLISSFMAACHFLFYLLFVFFCSSWSFSSPLLTCPPLSSRPPSIGALYLGSSSHLNWLAVNFRPPIAKWLICLSLALCLSFILTNYCVGRSQSYLDPSVTSAIAWITTFAANAKNTNWKLM